MIAIYLILIGVVLDELVRCGIRWYRAAHYLDLTPAEAEEMLREAYGEAARKCAVENALHAASRAIHGGQKPKCKGAKSSLPPCFAPYLVAPCSTFPTLPSFYC